MCVFITSFVMINIKWQCSEEPINSQLGVLVTCSNFFGAFIRYIHNITEFLNISCYAVCQLYCTPTVSTKRTTIGIPLKYHLVSNLPDTQTQ